MRNCTFKTSIKKKEFQVFKGNVKFQNEFDSYQK